MTTYTKTFPKSTKDTVYTVTITSENGEKCTLGARDAEVQQILKIVEK